MPNYLINFDSCNYKYYQKPFFHSKAIAAIPNMPLKEKIKNQTINKKKKLIVIIDEVRVYGIGHPFKFNKFIKYCPIKKLIQVDI